MSAPSSLLRFSSWAYFRFISASSSSSKTSMRACSRVLPQRTESRGSISSSKRKISLSSTRVFFETPLNYGMAQGNLIHRCLISEFSHKLVCLDVDILLAGGGLWGLNVACKELLSGLCPLLFESLWVVFFLIGSKQLIRV